MIVVAVSVICLSIVLFYASYSIQAGIYIRSFCRKRTTGKVVALTFDDGPDRVQTPKVLDVLKRHHAPATFFCIGSKIAGNEDILQRMVAENHEVGNHSYAHSWKFPLYTARRMTGDLIRCGQLLEQATGKRTNRFRPPFGVTNPTLAGAVKKLGYLSVGWNIRTLDTCSTQEEMLKRIGKKLRPGSVILLHDHLPQSELRTESVLNLLRDRQYKVISLEELINS